MYICLFVHIKRTSDQLLNTTQLFCHPLPFVISRRLSVFSGGSLKSYTGTSLPYTERLRRLNLQSLELRRLLTDLVWCYKIVFGLVRVNTSEFFELSSTTFTRGHRYKLFKKCHSSIRSSFFCDRVINAWNNLPANIVAFSSITRFKCSIYKQC